MHDLLVEKLQLTCMTLGRRNTAIACSSSCSRVPPKPSIRLTTSLRSSATSCGGRVADGYDKKSGSAAHNDEIRKAFAEDISAGTTRGFFDVGPALIVGTPRVARRSSAISGVQETLCCPQICIFSAAVLSAKLYPHSTVPTVEMRDSVVAEFASPVRLSQRVQILRQSQGKFKSATKYRGFFEEVS